MKRIWPAAAALLLAAAAGHAAFDGWIDRTVLPRITTETSVEVRDRNGDLLRAYQVESGIWRLAPRPGGVDADFAAMLLRYEDKRFHRHNGVDPLALLRAAGQAITRGRAVSGGSTLTMQVARLLEDGSTGRWRGKLRQMRVALALERRLDKDAILALYLSHAPYGGNLEGIRAGSIAWFAKEPARLTAAEAALLIALPQSPERRRPDRNPGAARAARDQVLARMADQGLLTPEEAAAARRAPVPRRMARFAQLAPHLSDRMRAGDPSARRFDLTIDAGVQARMERLVREAADAQGGKLSAALVAVDHTTGEVIASVGSPGYDGLGGRQGFVDMTRAIRSPGSTLKPLIYAMAFDQGLAHPETLIHDGPVMFGRYAPRNFDGAFHGDVPVRDALRMSLNIPAVLLTNELGPARVMAALRRSGADLHLPGQAPPGLAIALGGVGISLRDLTQLFAALAQGGRGPVLRDRMDAPRRRAGRLVSASAAWQVGDILIGVAPPPGAPAGAVAYKTGTSYGRRDAWAVGYDGRHVIGVWMGRADGAPVPGAFGAGLAAPVLFNAFGRLAAGMHPLPPPPPATLRMQGAALPQPLRRFHPRNAAFAPPGDAPQLLFPPDGARLETGGAPITLKLRGGAAPFSVLADGRPVARGLRGREFDIPNPGAGFSTLVVIDAEGRSDRATVRLDP